MQTEKQYFVSRGIQEREIKNALAALEKYACNNKFVPTTGGMRDLTYGYEIERMILRLDANFIVISGYAYDRPKTEKDIVRGCDYFTMKYDVLTGKIRQQNR